MQKTFRTILTTLATLVGALFVGILIFTAETAVDEAGYTSLVRAFVSEGRMAFISTGYADWVLIAAVFLSGGAISLWLNYLIRPKIPFTETKRKIEHRVEGRQFINQEVPLDGNSYTNCHFQNVTFVYNGGHFALVDNAIDGIKISSDYREILSFVALIGELNLINAPIYDSATKVEFDGIREITSEEFENHLRQRREGIVKGRQH